MWSSKKSNNIKPLIKGEIGREVVFCETIDSTNSLAMELGEKGSLHGTVVVADTQTQGRGRLGRRWFSPPGLNIYLSIIIRPALKSTDAPLLTLLAATACANALRNKTGVNAGIKWPNDLIVNNKKLGGILSEMKSIDNKMIFAVIGIGINLNSMPEDFPPELRETATSLRIETGKEIQREALVSSILNAVDHWYGILTQEGSEPVLNEWRRLNVTTGKLVRADTSNGTLTGIAEDIDPDGRLLVRLTSGDIKKISSGDVTILR